ncbi:MAG: phosphate ABC transporter ATP-binding protein [Dehalococcoidia bacterium]|nr:MAG: phosphate ABC transporter ATP-binding protein [Dehalococcoidia bacterium]
MTESASPAAVDERSSFDFSPTRTVASPVGVNNAEAKRVALRAEHISAWYGQKLAVSDVTLDIDAHSVTALIGPSGCGKSTLLRCLNRMHEVTPKGRVQGRVILEGEDIYGPGSDPTRVRQRIGMVFQKPNPFPTMSIEENVAAGLRFMNMRSKSEIADRVEASLKAAALWDEVKNDLKKPGMALSGGQQQRLCIARAIAVEPEVVLMDEPCSALDPLATLKVEDLMRTLAVKYTIVIVTHNMQQAARVSDRTAFMLAGEGGYGELIEYLPTDELFTNPQDQRTEDYITGRFG